MNLPVDNWEECMTYKIYYDEVKITDCAKRAKHIIVSDEIEGYPVTKIGEEVFSDCYQLQAVEIGNNVECIEKEAFKSSGLEYITIPDSVTEIEINALRIGYTIPENTVIRDCRGSDA